MLLVKTPSKRLGCGRAGLLELKRHAWFGGLDWKALIRKEIPAPVVPVLEHDKDTSNYEKYVERGDPEPTMTPGTCRCLLKYRQLRNNSRLPSFHYTFYARVPRCSIKRFNA